MTKEEKTLLLQDLCCRLPYYVKVLTPDGEVETLDSICNDDGFYFNILSDKKPPFLEGYNLEEVKPYLFPLSSLLEEQKEEFYNVNNQAIIDFIDEEIKLHDYTNSKPVTLKAIAININETDWLNKHHFDYRGLIDRGLALDATGLDIY